MATCCSLTQVPVLFHVDCVPWVGSAVLSTDHRLTVPPSAAAHHRIIFHWSHSFSLKLERTFPYFPHYLEDPTMLAFSEERCSSFFFNSFIVLLFIKGRQRGIKQHDSLGKLVLQPDRRVHWRMGSSEEYGWGDEHLIRRVYRVLE